MDYFHVHWDPITVHKSYKVRQPDWFSLWRTIWKDEEQYLSWGWHWNWGGFLFHGALLLWSWHALPDLCRSSGCSLHFQKDLDLLTGRTLLKDLSRLLEKEERWRKRDIQQGHSGRSSTWNTIWLLQKSDGRLRWRSKVLGRWILDDELRTEGCSSRDSHQANEVDWNSHWQSYWGPH